MKVYTKQNKLIDINESLEIQRGGEGAIIKIDNKTVAKIYHKGIIGISEAAFNYLKILPEAQFIVPKELLYSNKGSLVGFSMEYISTDFLPLSNLFGKNFCTKHNISSDFKQKIARKLIEALIIAHSHQIIIGDFNQFNILFSLSGEVKFIDTDSYQTPAFPHSGLLLDEIRDYLFQGIISKESDYFALSVLIFYIFTYAHPFKGISKIAKKMQDRMILKLPIFANNIKQPKVYTPIASAVLQSKFERLYIRGERFLLDLDSKMQIQAIKPQQIKSISHADLFIKQLLNKTDILDIEFNKTKGFAETKDNFIIFDASDKGQLIDFTNLKKADFQEVFVSSKNVLAKKGGKLFKIEKNGSQSEIANFQFPSSFKSVQYSDILLVIGNNLMYELSLDEVYNHSMKIKRTEIFSENISAVPSFTQNAGGNYRIFYNVGENLANLKIPFIPKQLKQFGNIGVAQFVENNELKNKYFRCNGLKLELSTAIELDEFPNFTYQQADNKNGFIYEAADDEIIIRRTQNFEKISTIKTNIVSASSKLFHTLSGIICFTDGDLYLLNKK